MFYEKRPVTLLKRDSSTGVFLWILGNFLITSFEEHLLKTASEKSVHEPSGSLFLIYSTFGCYVVSIFAFNLAPPYYIRQFW